LQFLALGEAEHARLVPDPQVTVAVLQLVDHLAGGYPGDENGVQFAVLVATADLVEEQDRLLRPLLAGDQPRHQRNYARPCQPSTTTSVITPTTRASQPRRRTQDCRQSFRPQGSLRHVRDFAGSDGPFGAALVTDGG